MQKVVEFKETGEAQVLPSDIFRQCLLMGMVINQVESSGRLIPAICCFSALPSNQWSGSSIDSVTKNRL